MDAFVFDMVVEINGGIENIFWIFFVINFILCAIAYELGFARKLPVGKTIFVYVMLLIGTFILTIFTTVMKMPTIESLSVIILVLAIYRFRLYKQRSANKQ
ncbi:YlaH-like family protein [Oceanobacillus massiliensis]|uniref:YlaH-like family protein n=1 Tax=Oceanobacillus massiliensis TaxID=1465765 RepID=UPI00028802D1|nr:YlaH-like family protein [Oceanobacillus massiliensis]